jgi:hypothetical protein
MLDICGSAEYFNSTRNGILVFATQRGARFGMGPDRKDQFECGGLELPGSPFSISVTNVN